MHQMTEGKEKLFFNTTKQRIGNAVNDKTILLVGGDFNCVMNNAIDRTNRNVNIDVGQIELKNMNKTLNIEDIWRRHHPDKLQYTWDGGDNRTNKSRIDYWLVSESQSSIVIQTKHVDAPFSDHNLIEITIKTNKICRGPGVWIMNVELLKSPLFDKCFLELWQHAEKTKDRYEDKGIWWDKVKSDIKQMVIKRNKKV